MTQSDRIIGGRYELRQLIGRGGMAQVHIGNDTRLNRIVAIKILRQDLARDPIFQARFRREAQSAANLNHPSIVAVYDTGEESFTASDGTTVQVPYIVMEYVEGHTVRELLTDGNPVPISEAVEIVSGVLDALEYAHHQNLVHRDIKPGNVMITSTGKVKVMDFGIARALSDSQTTMTQTDAVVGTAQYLSPEQARGEQVDARSDLYSTGCLLFELLTGKPPFQGDSAVAVAFQHVSQLPPLPSSIAPDIPPSLDRVVMKSLAKNREDRYPTAAAMRADLKAAIRGNEVNAPDVHTWEVPPSTGTTVLPPVMPNQRDRGNADNFSPQDTAFKNGYPTQTIAAPARQTRKSWLPLVFTILALLIVAVLGTGLYMTITMKNTKPAAVMVRIPALVGMNQEEVRNALNNSDLQMTMSPGESSETVPQGLFVKSSPEPGTKVKKDSKVKVTFSTGPGGTTVPSMAGLTQQQARSALKAAGLALGNITTVNSGTVEKDRVVSTNPEEGSSMKKGSTVDLQLASGNVLIPAELQGGTLEALNRFVSTNRISLITSEKETTDAPPNTVLSLDKAGQIVPLGSQLRATVAVAPTVVATPTEKPNTETPSPQAPTETPSPSQSHQPSPEASN